MKKRFAFILLIFILINSFVDLESLSQQKVGLVLSGGGARGLAHIGVLKVIDELGIRVDYIAGTSIGAFIGGLYAVGYSGEEIEQLLIDFNWDIFDDTVNRKDYYIGEKRWKDYYNVSFVLNESFKPSLPQGFIAGNKLINYLFELTYEYNHIRDFNDLPIPFASVATDLLTGEPIVYHTGSLPEAIRASISVPSIFKPFNYQDRLTIDGGIRMNVPTSVVQAMGADFIIAVRVTSDLRTVDRLTSPIAVLDQVINISSQEYKTQGRLDYDIMIEPNLEGFVSTDFDRISEFIVAGEIAAQKRLITDIHSKELPNSTLQSISFTKTGLNKLSKRIMFNQISVEGNKYLSSAKVREYTGLKSNRYYCKQEVLDGINRAYYSNLFSMIYPIIRDVNPASIGVYDDREQRTENTEEYDLNIRAIERLRNRIGVNLRYSEHSDITVGTILEMKNYFGNNSKFIASLDLGGQRELLFDYVKNFGREWGAYFRLFPYFNEHTIFFFNENQEKISSSKSYEVGVTTGIGGFFYNRIIVEPYLFSYYKKLYRDISFIDIDEDVQSSGVGIKMYYETLDATVFSMSGTEFMIKYAHSEKNVLSDYNYNKIYGRLQYLLPIINYGDAEYISRYSLRLQFEYGAYLDGKEVEYDPFYIGGIDSFLGLRDKEMSAPTIKTMMISGRSHIKNNIYIDLVMSLANVSKYDDWTINDETYLGGGLIIGYDTFLAPLRIGVGIGANNRVNAYLAFGYTADAFEFSRR